MQVQAGSRTAFAGSMPKQIPLNLRPDAPYSFQTFYETPSNQDALALVKAYPNWPSPILLLLGPKGSGKTHLGEAWAQAHDRSIYRTL